MAPSCAYAYALQSITALEFLNFLIDIDRGYLENPYHSFWHGADVFQVRAAACTGDAKRAPLTVRSCVHDERFPAALR